MNDETIIEVLVGYIDAGGFVMMPLVVAAMVLWYAIGFRMMTLQRGTRFHVRTLIRQYKDGRRSGQSRGLIDRAARQGVQIARRYPRHIAEVLDDAFFSYYQELKRGRTVIVSIVSIAPLVGLLGTVAGMIETFDSLGDNALFAQSGGIAGGISQALFSTQMGLCVAIPGVIVGRLLDRRQHRLEEELDQIKALLGGAA
ncbi:MAG: MotA/TolQ/ExbB proton channel family protein [Myxococcota bacterium]